MAGFAVTLDVSKFSAANIDYGTAVLPDVVPDGYTLNTDYTVVTDKFYTSDTGAGETALASLKTTNNGKYYIKVLGAGAYDGQTVYVDFWIKGIPVTINFDAVAKTFGEADADHPITYALTKKGAAWDPTAEELTDLGLTVSRAAGENVVAGGYAYDFAWTNENFTVTRVVGDEDVYTINPKNISASATIAAEQGDIVYTGKAFAGTYTVKDGETTLVAGTDYTVSTRKDVIANYKPTITFQGNYAGAIDAVVGFAITPAPIIVGVEDLEVVYDAANHKVQDADAINAAGKFTYSGLVGDDVVDATAIKATFTHPNSVVAKTDAIDAKDYELTISGGAGAGNYEFVTYMPGKLTIKRADLEIASANAEKSIGAEDPAFEIVPIAGLTITGVTFTREAGETAGEYTITPVLDAIVVKAGDKTVTANYNIKAAAVQGKLTIGKTKIYVSIKDADKFYGAEDPEFKYTVTGLNGDELAPFEITRDAGETVGAYTLTATVANPNAEKYSEVVVANGIFTIKKAELEITMPTQTVAKTTGVAGDLKKDGITATGINKAGDNIADLIGDLEFVLGVGVADDGTFDPGYKATLKVAEQANYKIVKVNGVAAADPTFATGKLIVGAGTAVAIAFTTADDDTDYNLIKAHAGETQDVSITLNNRVTREVPVGTAHPWAAETWNTMVLPFEVTVAELSAQLGYAIVNVVNPEKTTEGNVVFKLEMQKIPANTPFCVKTSAAIPDAKVLNFANKLIVDGGKYPSVDAGKGYKFVGAYQNLTINKTTPAYYFLRGDNAKWAHLDAASANTWTVVPFDAYIDQSGAAASARELTVTFQEIDGSLTAIKSVDADIMSMEPAKTGWYTIGGMKLQSAPTQKGVYIKDGKKVIVK